MRTVFHVRQLGLNSNKARGTYPQPYGKEQFIGVQQLEGVQYHNVPQEKGMKGERIVRCMQKKNGLQSEVLYYDDNAVLTMQCDAQSYFKL